jgi:multisubunit Na+/H+ antiporter MnhB subunit
MKGMTVIVKTISSWVKVLIFLFGIYIILFGHLTPGGGFAGGVILASSYVLLLHQFSLSEILTGRGNEAYQCRHYTAVKYCYWPESQCLTISGNSCSFDIQTWCIR